MHTCVCRNSRIQGCLIKFTFNRRCPAIGNLSCWFYLHVRPCGFSCWRWLWKKIAFASFLSFSARLLRADLPTSPLLSTLSRAFTPGLMPDKTFFCKTVLPTHLVAAGSLWTCPADFIAMSHPCGLFILMLTLKEINFCKQLPFTARFRRTDLLTSSSFVIILADENACRVWCADKRSFARLSIPAPGPLGFHKTSSHSFRLLNRNSFDSDAEESAFNGFSSSPGSPEPVSELPPEP